MDFLTYLTTKKIDAKQFETADSEKYTAWNFLFDQMHPESFTSQKLYLINKVRRKFPLEEKEARQKAEAPAGKPKPRIIPRIKK